MRVAELDMRDSSQQCPSGFLQNPRGNSSLRACVRTSYNSDSCESLFYNFTETYGFQYSQVCGKVIGYQYMEILKLLIQETLIADMWMVLVSPMEVHDDSTFGPLLCLLVNYETAVHAVLFQQQAHLAFVRSDYFCDTGNELAVNGTAFYPDDPLWDGAGCGPQNACCSFNTPPWFYKQLPQPTTEEIELSVCSNGISRGAEYVAIQQIQIYVQ